jgi:putative hydrolase of the HAD superfamily
VIEVVVVDLGGVAAHYHPEARLEAMSQLSGLSPAEVDDRIWRSGFDERAEKGEYTPDETMAFVIEALGGNIAPDAVIQAWSQAFSPNDDILAQIRALHAPAVLFTNNGPMIDACLEGPLRRIRDAFSDVVCSWHLKARKPEPAAFDRVAAPLGRAPETLLLLDDSAANVSGAIAAGWNAAQVTTADEVGQGLRQHSL